MSLLIEQPVLLLYAVMLSSRTIPGEQPDHALSCIGSRRRVHERAHVRKCCL